MKKIIDALRRRVGHGDVSAMCELGMWLQDGLKDTNGRAVLRSNSGYAFRLLKVAAGAGISEAFSSLGFTYDTGLGTKRNKARAEAGMWATFALLKDAINAPKEIEVHREEVYERVQQESPEPRLRP